jgi:hypothetical protein
MRIEKMSVRKKAAYLVASLCLTATLGAAAQEQSVAAATKAPARQARVWWAYAPLQQVAVPEIKNRKWARTPIDAFVLEKLEERNLKPSPDAPREIFIRRATLDVWGIIPTPEEVEAFVHDRSPQAYEKLVDRLLASPHYGERQGRRWLDLARYADSAGYTNDEDRPNAWRYRDYVIESFNHDKPYDRFIQEQVAGDELWPNSQEALVATGFLRFYPDDSNSRDLYEKKYENTTDMTDTVATVFMASSIGCARCHDHKFDRVSQKEYFQLQAFFANANARDDLPAAKGEQERQYEQARTKWEEATKAIRAQQREVLNSVRDKAETYQKERFFENTRIALNKPESEWTAHDRWINNRYQIYHSEGELAGYLEDSKEPANQERYARYKALAAELKKFDSLKPRAGSDSISAITELGHPDAPPTYLLHTGALEQRLEEVQPAVPELFNPHSEDVSIVPTKTSSGRRTALAKFIASPNNALTSRVFVNRIWGQYFGRGIVETVSDFGRAGQKPTHPELLDYLADKFVKQGWSTKQLHREILLSNVYRQASDFRPDAQAVDPDNKLLAAFPRLRMEAEQIRDSLLVASGQLVDKIGGPSVFPPIPATAKVDSRTGRYAWQASQNADDHNRRSVYVFVKRSQPYPFLDTFDMAAADVVHSKRDVTTTPLQSLALINSDAVFEWSRALAGRVINETGASDAARLERLYRILYSRAPDKLEKAALVSFLDTQEGVINEQLGTGKLAIAVPVKLQDTRRENPIRLAAFVDLAHALVTTNEFIYRY